MCRTARRLQESGPIREPPRSLPPLLRVLLPKIESRRALLMAGRSPDGLHDLQGAEPRPCSPRPGRIKNSLADACPPRKSLLIPMERDMGARRVRIDRRLARLVCWFCIRHALRRDLLDGGRFVSPRPGPLAGCGKSLPPTRPRRTPEADLRRRLAASIFQSGGTPPRPPSGGGAPCTPDCRSFSSSC